MKKGARPPKYGPKEIKKIENEFLTEANIGKKLGSEHKQVFPGKQPAWHEWADYSHTHSDTYGHLEPVSPSHLTCNILTDKWFEWLYRTPTPLNPFTNPGNGYRSRNAFLFSQDGASIYFANASPFVNPFDFKTVTMKESSPLLIPVYNVAKEDLSRKLSNAAFEKLILEDLAGIEKVDATFDNKPIHGCIVIRNVGFEISNIPADNVFGVPQEKLEESDDSSITVYHGGLWLLLRETLFKSGEEHLLRYEVVSKNYEISAKILINVLT